METALDTPRNRETKCKMEQTRVQVKMARASHIPFFVVLYRYSDTETLDGPSGNAVPDIALFAVRCLYDPAKGVYTSQLRATSVAAGDWRELVPLAMAQYILFLHDNAERVYHGKNATRGARLFRRRAGQATGLANQGNLGL